MNGIAVTGYRGGMRALLAGVIAVGCGGGPSSGDGGDGGNPGGTKITVMLTNSPADHGGFSFIAAYQDGDGAWNTAPSPSSDVYSFSVSSPIWGFAYTCEVTVNVNGTVTNLRNVVEYRFAVAERTTLAAEVLPRCTDRVTYVGLSGNISNRPATGTFIVAFNGRASFIDRATGNYELLVPPGTADLLVMHGSDRATPGDFLIDSSLIQRNVAVSTPTVMNIAGNTLAAAQNLTVTVPGTPISVSTVTNFYTTSATTAATANLSKAPLQSVALASGQAAPGDYYEQKVTAEMVANQGVTVSTTAQTATNFTYPQTTPLGAATTTTRPPMPYSILHTTWGAYANAIGYTWQGTQDFPTCAGFGACTVVWTAQLSPGAVGSSPAYTMPDLASVPGWKGALAFATGTMLAGEVIAMTSSAGAMDFPPTTPANGTMRTFAHSKFSITP